MASNNYSGKIFTLESFTNQVSNTSGNIITTLTYLPVADDAILVNVQGVAGAFAQFTSRSGTNVTFTVYQKYDRLTTVESGLTLLPSSVTADSTAGGPTFTTGGPSSTSSNGGNGTTNPFASTSHTHNVTINKISTHGHTVTQTATVLSPVVSTSGITLVVGYAFTA